MWPTTVLVLFLALQSNYYELGLKALDEKRYQEAVDNFINAIAAEPKDYSLHFNLALAYSLMGKAPEAIPEYKKTLEIKPGLYQAELNLAILLLREKQGADAVPYLTDAVSQKAAEFRPNFYLASALFSRGDFAKAEQAYKSALEIDPKSPDAELGLAHALAKQDKLADAAPHFQSAARMNPNYRDGLLELASLYEAAKQDSDAIEIYKQFPENPGAQERLGALLLASGQPADAIAHFQAAVLASPTPANRAALATAYLKNKEPDKALPVIEKVLAADPNDLELRMLHGRILRDQRKFPEAERDFISATKIKPDSTDAWSELASVLVVAENYPAALAALDRLAALHAEKAGHVFFRAIVLDKIHQQKPALESYQRFLAMSNGQNPNEEFQARQRIKILERELRK
jgi:tetratricopeptide (TPR) repeat protein